MVVTARSATAAEALGGPQGGAYRSPSVGLNGVVSAAHGLAATAGLRILMEGGNAVDAAVAAAAVLSVTEPHMTGIGGDMFAIVWLAKEQKLVALNASGRAGSRMTREALQARGFRAGSQQGVMSVTVPGALAGWNTLVRTYGRRTLAQLLQPAIEYAREVFPPSISSSVFNPKIAYCPATYFGTSPSGKSSLRSGATRKIESFVVKSIRSVMREL